MSMSSELISACQRRILSYVAPLWWLRTIRGRPYCTEALLSQTYIPNTLPHHDAHTRYSPERSKWPPKSCQRRGFLVIEDRRESELKLMVRERARHPHDIIRRLEYLVVQLRQIRWHVEGEKLSSPALGGVVVQPLKSWLMIEGHYAKGWARSESEVRY